MTKQSFLSSMIKPAFQDRWFVGLAIANGVIALAVLLGLALTITPKETQVITQFSSFGVTGFYRYYWYHLWNYGLLELLLVVGHSLLAMKLLHLERRDMALALLWTTLLLSVMVFLFARSIINIAILG